MEKHFYFVSLEKVLHGQSCHEIETKDFRALREDLI